MMADSNQFKILVTIPFDKSGIKLLEEFAHVDVRVDISPDELQNVIRDYHALIVGSETIVTGQAIEHGFQLQVIGVSGSSIDLLNVSAARAQGVTVINIPNPRILALAEQTISLILKMVHTHNMGSLSGKNLGIIGFGAVGYEVARRAQSFGMHVLVNQPRLTPQLALEVGIESCDLQKLLSESDIISLHLPDTPETKGLLGEKEFTTCQPECMLINTSHPGVIDLQALDTALKSSHLKAAAVIKHSKAINYAQNVSHPNFFLEDLYTSAHENFEKDVASELVNKVIKHLQSHQPGNPLSLKIVELDFVIPHEHFNPERVDNLANRLEAAEVLVNPPVVAKWEDYYIVLDGATRTAALKKLQYPHTVVQVVSVDDDHLFLHTWYHVICNVSKQDLMRSFQGVKPYQLRPVDRETMTGDETVAQSVCSFRLKGGQKYFVEIVPGVDRWLALDQFVADYTDVSRIERTLNTDMTELAKDYSDFTALVLFPQYTIEEVLGSAVNGQLLPAGITRFVIPGRVLRANIDLKYLKAEESLEKKNSWLDRLLADKMSRRRVRYYQEPVFLLDE